MVILPNWEAEKNQSWKSELKMKEQLQVDDMIRRHAEYYYQKNKDKMNWK